MLNTINILIIIKVALQDMREKVFGPDTSSYLQTILAAEGHVADG
jgi:hypothetical protein